MTMSDPMAQSPMPANPGGQVDGLRETGTPDDEAVLDQIARNLYAEISGLTALRAPSPGNLLTDQMPPRQDSPLSDSLWQTPSVSSQPNADLQNAISVVARDQRGLPPSHNVDSARAPTETARDPRSVPLSHTADPSEVTAGRVRDLPASSWQTSLFNSQNGIDPTNAPVIARDLPASYSRLYFLPEAQPAAPPASASEFQPPFAVHTARQDFPVLGRTVHGKPLIWLDNAATTQKPQQVIETLKRFYSEHNSNIHRGAHQLATEATDLYEGAREKVQRFLGARSAREIVFVRGTTEGINLVAQTYGRKFLQPGDEIVLTTLEHHANIVPWQLICQEKGAHLRVVPLNDHGEVQLQSYEQLLGPRTRLVAVSQVSNVLGTIVPVREMIALAHRNGARVLVDGAQAVPHLRVNVQELDADFYTFSGHKIFGPTGIGVLYGKLDLLDEMPPWQGGGNMIDTVTFEHTTFNAVPHKFEAGTGHIAGAIGLGAALDYVERLGFDAASRYEHALTEYAMQALSTVPGLRLIGTAAQKISVLSFVMEGRSSKQIGQSLDKQGIAVRAGHHCAQPALRWFGLTETVRPSLAFYNLKEEIDTLVNALIECQKQPPKG